MKNNKKKLAFNIQELDRKRSAKELHDVSLQNLSHLIHKLELASLYMDKDLVHAKLQIASVSKDINSIIDEIRGIVYDLRPVIFDDLGLKQALEKNLDRIKDNSSNMKIISDLDEISFGDEFVKISIFRIIQECVYNSVRHSKGKKIFISLKEKDDCIEFYVEDDGIGFNVEEAKIKENHFGLIVLEERAESISAKMKIFSVPNQGTKIHVVVPK